MVSDKAWEAADRKNRQRCYLGLSVLQAHIWRPRASRYTLPLQIKLRRVDRLGNDVLVNGPRFVPSTEAICYRCSSC